MSPVEKMYQLVNNEYAICFDAFTRRWTPGKPLHAKTKAIEGVLLKVLIYPNGLSEEFHGWLSIMFENLNDVDIDLNVKVQIKNTTERRCICIQKRSCNGIRKLIHHEELFNGKRKHEEYVDYNSIEEKIELKYTIEGFWKELNLKNNGDSITQKTFNILSKMNDFPVQKQIKPGNNIGKFGNEQGSRHQDNEVVKIEKKEQRTEDFFHWQNISKENRSQLLKSMPLPFCRLCNRKFFEVTIRQCKNGHLACGTCCVSNTSRCPKCKEECIYIAEDLQKYFNLLSN